jgi:hypothetical protein
MSRAALFAGAVICTGPAVAQSAYFAAIPDLPMPPGYVERDAGATFENEAGRIVLAEAEGESPGLAVRDFYYDSLPALGWAVSPRADGVLEFQRGRERLSFTVERAGSRTRLGARLVIRPASIDAD